MTGNDTLSAEDVKNVLHYQASFHDRNSAYSPPAAVDLQHGTVRVNGDMRDALQKTLDYHNKQIGSWFNSAYLSHCGMTAPIKITVDIALTVAEVGGPAAHSVFFQPYTEGLFGACGGDPNPVSPAGKAFMSKVKAIHYKLGYECHPLASHPEFSPWDKASFDASTGTLTIWISELAQPGNTAGIQLWVLEQ